VQQEAAVGFVADHAFRPVGGRLNHRGHDEGRADAGAAHLRKPPALLDRCVAAHRRADRVRAEEAGAQNPRHVAAQPGAVFIADKGAVTVAVSGDERVKALFGRPAPRQFHVLGADSFGVHRDEFLRTAQRRDFRPESAKDFHQHIASDG
jgi:predicted NAD/FAD-dependent oxidoreductase